VRSTIRTLFTVEVVATFVLRYVATIGIVLGRTATSFALYGQLLLPRGLEPAPAQADAALGVGVQAFWKLVFFRRKVVSTSESETHRHLKSQSSSER
jgi:hypothetical protein